MQSSCHSCHRLFARQDKVLLFSAQLEALRKGDLELLPAMEQARNLVIYISINCGKDSSAAIIVLIDFRVCCIVN